MGLPVIRITADHKDNGKAAWGLHPGQDGAMVHGIAVEKGPTGTMGPSTHAYGGTRMRDNRASNVVNRWGFAHEVPNLGIFGRIGDGDEWGA
jgi:hypothetical protein